MAAAASGLFASSECSRWRRALACYEEVVRLCAAQKSKSKSAKSKTDSLVDLDRWYQQSLPAEVASRDKPYLTHQELAKLMKWKLTRGKFRPRLTELVKENVPEDVERITAEGIACLPNLEAAVKHLSQLRAVGPATASAILCVAAPHQAPFMADEAVMAATGPGKISYNVKSYLSYAELLREKCEELNTLDQTTDWVLHKVELALWSYHYALKHKPALLELTQEEVDETQSSSGSLNEGEAPPIKKQKLQPS